MNEEFIFVSVHRENKLRGEGSGNYGVVLANGFADPIPESLSLSLSLSLALTHIYTHTHTHTHTHSHTHSLIHTHAQMFIQHTDKRTYTHTPIYAHLKDTDIYARIHTHTV